MSGFGGSGWGGGPWGGDTFDDVSSSVTIDVDLSGDTLTITESGGSYTVPLRVQDAVATTAFTVRVDFSQDLDITYPALSLISNYTIPGLTVLGVAILNSSQVELTTTPAQLPITYTVTVGDAVSLNGDSLGPDDHANFGGFVLIPTFLAGAESTTKVELVFSTAMTVNSALTSTASYRVQATDGGAIIPIVSAVVSGPLPRQRVTLILGVPLISKQYYAVTVANTVISVLGLNVVPNMYIMQWADMTQPVFIAPLEIPIEDFSGEVRGGLLGNPDGQVFFSPAFETVGATSTIELEQLSVCTKAYDEYTIPSPPDPLPLMTFSPGSQSVIGPSTVLWAPAWRLGQVQMTLGRNETDSLQPVNDGPAYATLVETIDITRASFLNDLRWSTFPGSIAFRTADNKTSIGPGPTSLRTLDWPKIVIGDEIDIDDEISLRGSLDLLLNDTLSVSDVADTGIIAVDIADAVNVSDVLASITQYSRFTNDSVFTTDVAAPTVFRNYLVSVSDALDVTDSVVAQDFDLIDRSGSDSVSVSDNDTIDIFVTHVVSVSDAIVVTEAAVIEPFFTFSITDSDAIDIFSDSISITTFGTFQVSVSDSVSATDSAVTSKDSTESLADSATLTDSILAEMFLTISVAANDTVSVTDSAGTDFVYGIFLADVVVVTESLLIETFGNVQTGADDTIDAITDSLAVSSEFGHTLLDTVSGTDSLLTEQFVERDLNDTISVTDSEGNFVDKGVADIADITDSVAITFNALIDLSVSDSVTITESTISERDLEFNDTLDVIDSEGNFVDKGVADAAAVTDSVVWDAFLDRTLSDTVTVTDTLIEPDPHLLALTLSTDTVSVTDSESNLVDKTLGDTISVTDSVTGSVPENFDVVLSTDAPAATDGLVRSAPIKYHDTTYSPVALWQFNGNLNDSSGNGHTLAVNAGTAAYTYFGSIQALDFSGASLQYTTTGTALQITGDMTIEMLVALNVYTANGRMLSYGGAGATEATNQLYTIGLTSSGYAFIWVSEDGVANTDFITLTGFTLPLNQLCHFAVTRTSNVIRFYLNGQPLGSASTSLTAPTGGTSSFLRVGSDESGSSGPAMTMASLKIIASALTGAQILGEYQLTLGQLYG